MRFEIAYRVSPAMVRIFSLLILIRPWDRIHFARRDFGQRRGAREAVYPCDPQRASDEAAGQKTPGPAGCVAFGIWLRCSSVEDPPGTFSFVAPEPDPKCDATKCILSHGLISTGSPALRFSPDPKFPRIFPPPGPHGRFAGPLLPNGVPRWLRVSLHVPRLNLQNHPCDAASSGRANVAVQ